MKPLFVFLCLSFFLSCNSTSDSESNMDTDVDSELTQSVTKTTEKKSDQVEKVNCKYGQPVAIFSEKLDQISKQSFEVNGQKGVEIVEFTDGRYLELYQSGCNEIRQEYRFTLKGEYKGKSDDFWFAEAINQLSHIGRMDERYAVIGIWVGELERLAPDMTIGQFKQAEQGTFIMVDKIVESGASMVVVVLEAREIK